MARRASGIFSDLGSLAIDGAIVLAVIVGIMLFGGVIGGLVTKYGISGLGSTGSGSSSAGESPDFVFNDQAVPIPDLTDLGSFEFYDQAVPTL